MSTPKQDPAPLPNGTRVTITSGPRRRGEQMTIVGIESTGRYILRDAGNRPFFTERRHVTADAAENAAKRVNKEGDPCPDWCTIHPGSESVTHMATLHSLVDGFAARIIGGLQSGPEYVLVNGSPNGYAFIPPREAADFAKLIEALGDLNRDQHRSIAAAIRLAAADAGES